MGEWIQKFKGRNESLAVGSNFLWKEKNIYVMDNHRAALWCWLQHMEPRCIYGLFHVDAHYDFGTAKHAMEVDGQRELDGRTFQEYLALAFETSAGETCPIIRWDNYLTVLAAWYPKSIGTCFMATHGVDAEPPDTWQWEPIEMANLPGSIGPCLENPPSDGWIVNVDVDYFFYSREEGERTQLQRKRYILDLAAAFRKANEAGQVMCLTVCLSPECCGGWRSAEGIAGLFLTEMGIKFNLP